MSKAWIETYTGHKVYPGHMTPEQIRIVDIAHGLSNTPRFAGQTKFFYSVAQHSMLVASMVPDELKLAALLHDGSEAYLQDVPRPIKHLPEMIGYRKLEVNAMDAICEAYQLSNEFYKTLTKHPAVKEADEKAVCLEGRYLMSLTDEPDWIEEPSWREWAKIQPKPYEIQQIPQYVAKNIFLDRFVDYQVIFSDYKQASNALEQPNDSGTTKDNTSSYFPWFLSHYKVSE